MDPFLTTKEHSTELWSNVINFFPCGRWYGHVVYNRTVGL